MFEGGGGGGGVADSQHLMRIRLFLLWDPDPAFYFNADPDHAFYFNADPDPAFHFHEDPDPDPPMHL
jgi:hypothetical protein